MIFTPTRLITTGVIWTLVGLGFALVQFTASEILYRVGLSSEEQALHDISEAITWPASVFYTMAEKHAAREALQSLAESGKDGAQEAREFLDVFDNKFDRNEEWTTGVWDFLNTKEITPEVSTVTEYLIYGSTCLGWGFLIFLAGSLVTLAVLRVIPERHPLT